MEETNLKLEKERVHTKLSMASGLLDAAEYHKHESGVTDLLAKLAESRFRLSVVDRCILEVKDTGAWLLVSLP